MRIYNLIILLFLLAAFGIGISLHDNNGSLIVLDKAINNASNTIENITLIAPNDTNIPNAQGFFLVIEKYVKFIGALLFEILRAGVKFGFDNPQYFSPEFIIRIIKLIIIALIISLLIRPLGYLIAFIIVGIIALRDKIKKRKEK